MDGRERLWQRPESTRDHMEIRGIGIINVAAMFGIKSIRQKKRIDLIVYPEGVERSHRRGPRGHGTGIMKILGVDIPHIIIPVRPGRDLARLIEVAAFQTKLKMSGHNAAQELNDRLIAHMNQGPPPPEK